MSHEHGIWRECCRKGNSKHTKLRHPISLTVSGIYRPLKPIHISLDLRGRISDSGQTPGFIGEETEAQRGWASPKWDRPHREQDPELESPDITTSTTIHAEILSAASPGNDHLVSAWMLLVTGSSLLHEAMVSIIWDLQRLTRLALLLTWILPSLGWGLTPSLSSSPGSPFATRRRS